eukprot:TRINITY_DN77816_c0_g1_i1.p3 TRINITY_DN77816_c0_g1~~TRINITY_DN77816_c0_g1_i1.p3  ORF type:complete len:165 (-),score=28.15 TRINITY_DN77816_c0_g1_i1:2-472(-)
MLALSATELEHAREHYEQFLASARLDRSEPIETDERAQAETASELAEAFEQPVHDYETKIDKQRTIDFGPKEEVTEGAIVNVGGRHFVIGVEKQKQKKKKKKKKKKMQKKKKKRKTEKKKRKKTEKRKKKRKRKKKEEKRIRRKGGEKKKKKGIEG